MWSLGFRIKNRKMGLGLEEEESSDGSKGQLDNCSSRLTEVLAMSVRRQPGEARWPIVVQLLSQVWLCVTPWTAARQASLSFTISRSLPKLMSIESVMPSNHFILCHPLFLLPSIFPNIWVFSNESRAQKALWDDQERNMVTRALGRGEVCVQSLSSLLGTRDHFLAPLWWGSSHPLNYASWGGGQGSTSSGIPFVF